MSRTEVRVPKYPECWESCGSCAQGEVTVDAVLVSPGQKVARDDTLIVLETGKVALDIPSPVAGVVIEVAVSPYDPITEGDLIAVIET
jgi:pyruvate dehydrogenase E2 component (dihydrolipoamide acetyltransferase)